MGNETRAPTKRYMKKYEAGDAIAVRAAGEWHRGTVRETEVVTAGLYRIICDRKGPFGEGPFWVDVNAGGRTKVLPQPPSGAKATVTEVEV